jgi:hypothetical protein
MGAQAEDTRRATARVARSIIREKIQYLGRVVAPDKEAAIARAMEEFNIEPRQSQTAAQLVGLTWPWPWP